MAIPRDGFGARTEKVIIGTMTGLTEQVKVKEISNPVEGEYTLDNLGRLVVYRNGQWILAENGR
jgi:hypothetical protein